MARLYLVRSYHQDTVSTLRALVQRHQLGWHLIDKFYVLMLTSKKQCMKNGKNNTEFASAYGRGVKFTISNYNFLNAIFLRYFTCIMERLELVVHKTGKSDVKKEQILNNGDTLYIFEFILKSLSDRILSDDFEKKSKMYTLNCLSCFINFLNYKMSLFFAICFFLC